MGAATEGTWKALTLNAQKQLNHPPVSRALQELPAGNKESKPTLKVVFLRKALCSSGTEGVHPLPWTAAREQHYHIHDLKASEC